MDKINNENKVPPNIYNIDIDCIPRCPEWNLISSLELNYNEGYSNIIYECENGHKGDISLKEYSSNYNKYSLSKQKCEDCRKNQKEIKSDFFYCSQCNKFLCYLCQMKHPNGDKHNVINFKRYDSYCKIHSNSFCFYCMKCKKNICIYCKSSHESHDLVDLSKFNFSEETKKKIEDEIKNIELKFKNLDILKEKIISQIDKLKESSELEIKFIKILLFSYKFEEMQKNINYNIFQNLKNFEETFKLNKIGIYDKIFKEGNKFISLLQNMKVTQSNPFKNNFKVINNHTSSIVYLSQLKDGRLASSSSDYCLNIYKRETFELQLSIKEDTSPPRSFTEISNERIFACYDNGIIRLIKLIGEDKYQVEQVLKEHSSCARKIIEIKENELISVAYDGTMKIWKLNNENKFICVKTINFQSNNSYCNILKLNENEFVVSSYSDKCIKFYNLDNYSNIATINNIETEWTVTNMCLLEDDILCVGGNNSKGFYLIKISNHQLIKNIIGPKIIYCIKKCIDDLFLCSIIDEKGNHSLVKYKFEDLNLKKVFEKEKAHDSHIYSCTELNNGIVVSGGGDNLIKLWKE